VCSLARPIESRTGRNRAQRAGRLPAAANVECDQAAKATDVVQIAGSATDGANNAVIHVKSGLIWIKNRRLEHFIYSVRWPAKLTQIN
jgi:hypothetical protein